jgi:hypothetical protein
MYEKDIDKYLTNNKIKPNKRNLKKLLHDIEKARKKAMIVNQEGLVITAFNKN